MIAGYVSSRPGGDVRRDNPGDKLNLLAQTFFFAVAAQLGSHPDSTNELTEYAAPKVDSLQGVRKRDPSGIRSGLVAVCPVCPVCSAGPAPKVSLADLA